MLILRAIGQAALSFLVIFVVVRLLGKMEVSQGRIWNFVSAIVLGSLGATMATTGIEGLAPLAVAIITWGFLTFTVSYIALKNRSLRSILEGKPTVIIQNGKILEEQAARNRYDMDRLVAELRQKQVASLSDVEFALLEVNGNLSVIFKSQARWVTPADLNLPTPYTGLSTELIVDGQVIRQNLAQVKLTEDWLRAELALRGIDSPSEVMLATLDTRGRLYVDVHRDRLQSPQRPGDLPDRSTLH
ncbi:MAG: YetF domain-containing protein [Bacillota bacterium]